MEELFILFICIWPVPLTICVFYYRLHILDGTEIVSSGLNILMMQDILRGQHKLKKLFSNLVLVLYV